MDRLTDCRFAHIVSLGCNCYTSALFQRLNLRRYSGPFDWMFTTVPMVQACIESDFEQFLDRRHYRPVVRADGHIEHKHTFYQTHWAANFTHYNPLADKGHDYLDRCVGRFRRVMTHSDPKMFLFIAPIHAHERDQYVDDFAALYSVIAHRTDNATMVGVTVTKGDDVGLVEAARSERSRLFHYTSGSLMAGLAFRDPADDAVIERLVTDLTLSPPRP